MSNEFSSTIRITLSIYAGTIIGAITVILLPWALQTEENVGFYRFLNSSAYLISYFCGLGMFQTIQKFFPHYENKELSHYGFFRYTWLGPLVVFGAFIIIMVLSRHLVLSLFFKGTGEIMIHKHYLLIGLLSGVYLVFGLAQSVAQAFDRLGHLIFCREVILRFVTLMLALFTGFLLVSTSAFYNYYLGINIVILIWGLHWMVMQPSWSFGPYNGPPKLDRPSLRQFSLFSFLNQANTYLVENIDAFLITFLAVKGMADTGVFSIFLFMGQVIAIPQRAMYATFAPRIARAFHQQNYDLIHNIYKKSALMQLIISGLMYMLLEVNINSIIQFFSKFGDGYAAGGAVAIIIGFGKLVDSATGINSAILNFSAYYRWNFIINFILLLILIIADVLLIPSYGLQGAAVATALAYIVYNLIKLVVIYNYLKVQPFDSNTLKTILIIIAGILLCSIIPRMGSIYSDMIFRTFIVGVYYGLSVYFLKLSADINRFIDQTLIKLRLMSYR